jgi:hypothetical protein
MAREAIAQKVHPDEPAGLTDPKYADHRPGANAGGFS